MKASTSSGTSAPDSALPLTERFASFAPSPVRNGMPLSWVEHAPVKAIDLVLVPVAEREALYEPVDEYLTELVTHRDLPVGPANACAYKCLPSYWEEAGRLEVLANNPTAQRLYERLGFHPEGRREAAVLPGGQAVDAILMAKLWPERLPKS